MAESEWKLDHEDLLSEAYQHGRTLSKLNAARLALAKILTITNGRVGRNLLAISAIAKLGMELSAPESAEKEEPIES